MELYGFVQPTGSAKRGGGGAPRGAASAHTDGSSGQRSKKAKLEHADGSLSGLEHLASPLAVANSASDSVSAVAASGAGLAAQLAAVRLLGSVLGGAGALLQPELRSQYDASVAHLACVSAEAAAHVAHEAAVAGGAGAAVKAMQLECTRSLLASVLVPRDHRPPFLTQAGVTTCAAVAVVIAVALVVIIVAVVVVISSSTGSHRNSSSSSHRSSGSSHRSSGSSHRSCGSSHRSSGSSHRSSGCSHCSCGSSHRNSGSSYQSSSSGSSKIVVAVAVVVALALLAVLCGEAGQGGEKLARVGIGYECPCHLGWHVRWQLLPA